MKKALAALAAVLLAAPTLAQDAHIVIRDGALVPRLGAGVDIWPRGVQASVPHTGHGLELGVSVASGEDEQRRSAGEPPLTFGGQSFAAPTTIRYEFDFRYFELLYRYRHFFPRPPSRSLGIEALAGVGGADLELTAWTPAQRATNTLRTGGVVFGFGALWKFLPKTSLQSRITIFASGKGENVTDASRFDLFVAHALGPNVALRGGVTQWTVNSERDAYKASGSPNSNIDARFGGIAIGLEAMF